MQRSDSMFAKVNRGQKVAAWQTLMQQHISCNTSQLSCRRCYPGKYKAYTAARRLGKMPIVLVTLSKDSTSRGKNGSQAQYVIEKDSKTDYGMFYQVLDKFSSKSHDQAPSLTREKLATLQKLASSEKDKRLIKYAATSHLSSKKAKHHYGIGNHKDNKRDVENAMAEAEEIEAAYYDIKESADEANQQVL